MESKLIRTLIVIILISAVINESKQSYLTTALEEFEIIGEYLTEAPKESMYEDYNKATEKLPAEDWQEETTYIPIDYEKLRENHEILEENICENYYSIYDDPWLCEQLADIVEITEDFNKDFNQNEYIEYFLFDFNGDGIDEYLISCNGYIWSGVGGHWVELYQKTEEGTLKQIFQELVELENYWGGYWPIAVLNEKTNGYYDFVLPWKDNRIWKYDAGKKEYVTNQVISTYE